MFYIYAYIRRDGSPYYIGKGKDKRAWKKGKEDISPPKDMSKIIIMESNLSEIGAFALERFYIRWYGRKDNNTGILRNLTDGGDGCSGKIVSEETKEKMRLSHIGKKHSLETRSKISKSRIGQKANFKSHSEETKKKLSEIGKTKVGHLNSFFGKHHSEDTKNKIRLTKSQKTK